MTDTNYYLIVERPENWRADSEAGFKQFGLRTRHQRLANGLQAGDVLITYVSGGCSAIADCRSVTRSGASPSRGIMRYDDVFPLVVYTAPIVTLPPSKWIAIHGLLAQLVLTRDRPNWNALFQTSIRSITSADGIALVDAIRTQQGR